MPVSKPTLEELKAVAEKLHFNMSDTQLEEYQEVIAPNFEAYTLIEELEDWVPEVNYSRSPGVEPAPKDNPLGAWYIKASIKGRPSGPLAGHKVVVKDNICVAGLPMMNGASTLEGYVPDIDATVVTRILDAGGEIVGKAHCEYFCLSGASHTNAKGPVLNPHDVSRSSGGASSGCGALVGSGEVAMAIGCDQGGSIRIPAAWSGCVGMKPTWGLVPYSGIMPIETTLDYAGPITANVRDNALLLSVIAGADDLDPRQYCPVIGDYMAALTKDVAGLKIGVVSEGFDREDSEPDVDEKVRLATERFKMLGCEVEPVSAPMHQTGQAIWLAIVLDGLTEQMMDRNGFGLNWKGLYVTSLLDAHANWRRKADDLSDSLKSCMLTGRYMLDKYNGRFYGKAQNLNRQLTQHYNERLAHYDALIMPTIPMKATPIPGSKSPLSESVQRAFEMVGNTCQFDATGHPAISVPCGMSDGLPVGMMLVGKHFDEATLYALAQAYEGAFRWRDM
ncbi:MAG: amidase [Sphingomonadales bacterium]